jgi:hypothetical protein
MQTLRRKEKKVPQPPPTRHMNGARFDSQLAATPAASAQPAVEPAADRSQAKRLFCCK